MQYSTVMYLVHLIGKQNDMKYEYSNKMDGYGTLVVEYCCSRHEVTAVLVYCCCNRLVCFKASVRTHSVRYYCDDVHQ